MLAPITKFYKMLPFSHFILPNGFTNKKYYGTIFMIGNLYCNDN